MATTLAPAPVASPTKAQRSSHFYRPELDALRFFAFLAVLTLHTTYFPVGYFTARHVPAWLAKMVVAVSISGARGVDLFFVLSAYLITELLLREKDRLGYLDVRSFYIRRILRIWPLYYCFVLAAAIIPFMDPWHGFSGRHIVSFLLLGGNWALILFGSAKGCMVEPLWSVSIEEQFYLFWPPVVARLSRRQIAIAALAMIAVGNLFRLGIFLRHGTPWQVYFSTFGRLDSMAGGILLAVLLNGKVPNLRAIVRLGLVVLAFTCIAFTGSFEASHPHLTLIEVLIVYPAAALGCTGIVFAFLGAEIKIRALQYLGKISYGLYVFHTTCLRIVDRELHVQGGLVHMLLRPILTLTLAIVIASISYAFLETPFLNLKRRFTHVQSRPV